MLDVRTAKANGVDLEYALAGDGPELVWVHGLGGNLHADLRLAERLAATHRVLWYSSRGHGRSTPVSSVSGCGYDCYADDLAGLLDAVGFERPLLAGGSHGSNTILRHEVRHPGRARALLLIAPAGNSLRRPPLHHLLALRFALWRGLRRDDLLGLAFGEQLADAQMAEAAATHDPGSLAFLFRHLPWQQAVEPEVLREIRVPTEVLAWHHDPVLHPIAVARRIAALIPGAIFREIERRAELGLDETADYAASVVLEWAAGVAEHA